MSTVPALLSNELHRLRDDSSGGRADQDTAEVEELVSKAVHLYSRLNRQHERWASRIREGLRPFIMEEAKPWQSAFQQWAQDARAIILLSRSYEDRGYFIDQLESLRLALIHCPYDGVDIEQLIASVNQVEQGMGISAAEMRNELQSRLRAESR